jgi:NDP-sugar pyrophosphorylase family protein
VLTTLDLAALSDYHRAAGAAATIAMHPRRVDVNLGVLQFNGQYELTGYDEKPSYDFQVSMGIYVFEPRVLSFIPYNRYLDFPDLVLDLIGKGEKVVCYPFEGYWQDLGRPDDYEQAVLDFETIRPQILGHE